MNGKILLIDAENCSVESFYTINWHYEKKAEKNCGIYCFGLKSERSTHLKAWFDTCNKTNITGIWLDGLPSKNKVDNAIISKIRSLLNNPRFAPLTTYCLMTNDGDFTKIVQELKRNRKNVTIYGKCIGSTSLITSADEFIPCDLG